MPRSRPFVAADPKAVARARRLYERGHAPVEEIAAGLGMSARTFYQRIRVWGWTRRRRRRGGPNRAAGTGRGPAVAWSPAEDQSLWLGARWTVDGKVSDRERRFVRSVEANLAALADARAGSVERWARAVRALAQAKRELLALEDERAREGGGDEPEEDLEEMRRRLARRMEALREGRLAGHGDASG